MNENEQKRFKRNYDERDYSECMNNPEFKKIWDSGTLEDAGRVATNILKGTAQNKREARENEGLYKFKKKYLQ